MNFGFWILDLVGILSSWFDPPLAPLFKGGTGLEVPFFKEDLGGSFRG